VLGRGRQQLRPAVVDTGDSALDAALISRRYFSVIVGYHYLRLVKATD
jgi:hypothetical protein